MLRALQTFLAVHRDGTFSRAGARIGLTQSAVSAQIKKLEEFLEAEVFVRGQRHAALTEAGRRLVPLAEQMVAQAAELPRRVRSDLPGGRLRIGAIASVQGGILPDALARYKADFPAVDLHIVPGVSSQLLERIDAGELDLALLVKPPFALPANLHWTLLWREPFALAVPESVEHDDVPALLRELPFIRYDRAAYGGRLVQAFLVKNRIAVQDAMELDDLHATVCMVERGLGVALIPLTPTLHLDGRRIRMLPLGKDAFYREIGVIGLTARAADPLCTGFVATLMPSGTVRQEQEPEA